MELLVQVIQYQDADHRRQVIQLWEKVFGYQAPHNDPALTIDKKLLKKDELFFVAEADGIVFGTAMAGYDGQMVVCHCGASTSQKPWSRA